MADIVKIVSRECDRVGLDKKLILALIKVESNFNPNAVRYERQFIHYFKVEEFAKIQRITKDTETCLQKFSWGLMQLMGASARWCGYPGFLPGLCDGETNIIWGCEYFKKSCAKYIYLTDQISAYNGGSARKDPTTGKYFNQEYVDKVLTAMDALDKELARVSNLQ